MVYLVFFLQPPEDGDGVLDRGLPYVDGLEAALERGVLFDVLLVFVERGGADAAQLPSGQGGLEHIGGVDRPFGRARTHQGVELVDEQDHVPGRFLDFAQDRLQPVLEFSPVLRARQHAPQVKGCHLLPLESLRDVPRDDSLRQPFHDSCLAYPRFPDQHGIVFRAARQDLDHSADLVVPPDHGIEFPPACEFGQVLRVALERLVFILRVGVGHPLAAADGCQCLEQVRFFRSLGAEEPACEPLAGRQGQQEVFGRDVFVLELVGLPGRLLHQCFHPGREGGTRPLHPGQGGEMPLEFLPDGARRYAQLLEQRRHQPVILPDQRVKQVLGRELGACERFRLPPCRLQGFLCLEGEFVQPHVPLSSI